MCKEFDYVTRECPKRRARVVGAEMSLELQLPSGNDDAQE